MGIGEIGLLSLLVHEPVGEEKRSVPDDAITHDLCTRVKIAKVMDDLKFHATLKDVHVTRFTVTGEHGVTGADVKPNVVTSSVTVNVTIQHQCMVGRCAKVIRLKKKNVSLVDVLKIRRSYQSTVIGDLGVVSQDVHGHVEVDEKKDTASVTIHKRGMEEKNVLETVLMNNLAQLTDVRPTEKYTSHRRGSRQTDSGVSGHHGVVVPEVVIVVVESDIVSVTAPLLTVDVTASVHRMKKRSATNSDALLKDTNILQAADIGNQHPNLK